ncbi:hypothetical protein OUO18_06655 [Streptococcus thermophilus]|nr:hypothetical protein OUO18_06655 [Streptococcus thermophilus]
MSRFEDYYDKKLFFQMDSKVSSNLNFLGGLEDCFYKLVKLNDTELIKMSDEFFSEKTKKIENIIQNESSIMKLATSPCLKIFVLLSFSKPVISFDNRLETIRLSSQG